MKKLFGLFTLSTAALSLTSCGVNQEELIADFVVQAGELNENTYSTNGFIQLPTSVLNEYSVTCDSTGKNEMGGIKDGKLYPIKHYINPGHNIIDKSRRSYNIGCSIEKVDDGQLVEFDKSTFETILEKDESDFDTDFGTNYIIPVSAGNDGSGGYNLTFTVVSNFENGFDGAELDITKSSMDTIEDSVIFSEYTNVTSETEFTVSSSSLSLDTYMYSAYSFYKLKIRTIKYHSFKPKNHTELGQVDYTMIHHKTFDFTSVLN